MTPMRALYIDMNSFYAACEQHADPRLRGKPVGITAVEADTGALIAASIEAKRRGVKNVMRLADARAICPEIVLRPCRHLFYREINQQIAGVIDTLAELDSVRSIDEFQVRLGGGTADLDEALALAKRIKAAIRTTVGTSLRCSIGIGPNALLAKIAGKLEKPDGLTWLAPEILPERIAHLALNDLPGISRGIRARLHRAGIETTEQLYRLDPRHARRIWGSVTGLDFVRALQGLDVPLKPTERGGYGNSKILAPTVRTPKHARLVGRWLMEKAALRLRRDGWCTRRVVVTVSGYDKRQDSRAVTLTATQDTFVLLDAFERLWARLTVPRRPVSLSVYLGDVIALNARSGELFMPLEPGKPNPREHLSAVIDRINQRYPPGADGKRIITLGQTCPIRGFSRGGERAMRLRDRA